MLLLIVVKNLTANRHDIQPTQLTQMLYHWQQTHGQLINPVWLNNDGQSVLALLPTTAFYLLSPSHKKNNQSSLTSLTLQSQPFNNKVKKEKKISNVPQFCQQLIDYCHQQTDFIDTTDNTKPYYNNGLIGFIGYDVSAQHLTQSFDQTQINNKYFYNKHLAKQNICAYFAHYPIYLTYNNDNWQLTIIDNDENHAQQLTTKIIHWLSQIINNKKSKLNGIKLQPVWTQSHYNHAFDKVQNYLRQGDCYQINLTQQWIGQLQQEYLADYLPQLHTATNAPFAGYLGLADFELLSCSPELFLTFEKNKNIYNKKHSIDIITKPIKGTRPRGRTTDEDQRLQNDLANSEKDLAENVMIVDLLRNDLGKYAQIGTVNVPKRFAIESFSNVHHMVSTITATIKDDIHPLTLLFDSLPAGSITGTPKKRSVEIINELEQQARGAYCGTMGYINFDGTGQFNVLIRTLQADSDGNVSLWAGGGITIASQCEAEYQECFDKVGNIVRLLRTTP